VYIRDDIIGGASPTLQEGPAGDKPVYEDMVWERKMRRWIPAPDQVEGRLCAGMTGENAGGDEDF